MLHKIFSELVSMHTVTLI